MVRSFVRPCAPQSSETARLAPPQLHRLLRRIYHQQSRTDRRGDGRYPFPTLVELTPVDESSLEPLGETIVVVGKDLSEHGLGFFHPTPISFRHAIVSIDIDDETPLRMLIDLSWCRFTGRGWYENGGRFLRAVASSPPAA